MDFVKPANYVADKLADEMAKLVILSGSAARGKENPSDLDISAVFPSENKLLDPKYRDSLVKRLSSEVGYKIDLFDFAEKNVDILIDFYNQKPKELCWHLASICMDNVKEQWKGWPLAWIFGDEARKRLDPYGCFQDEMVILYGQEYLDELRFRINF